MESFRVDNLLDLCTTGGCGSKAPLERVEEVLSVIDQSTSTSDPNLSILDDFGDCSVNEISNPGLLVSSIDFGTPISNNAREWGAVAAENALSDIWAVGGRPLTCLAIVGWPFNAHLPLEGSLTALLEGATRQLHLSKTRISGGHTIESPTPFFGLSVTGIAEKGSVRGNNRAEPGLSLVLTKPIGTGLAITGNRLGLLAANEWEQSVSLMTTSNFEASNFAAENFLACSTDISGFGLIGHSHLMAQRSAVSVVLYPERVPILDACKPALNAGTIPRLAEATLAQAYDYCPNWAGATEIVRLLLADPQTSGGLLMAMPKQVAEEGAAKFPHFAIVGETREGVAGEVRLRW